MSKQSKKFDTETLKALIEKAKDKWVEEHQDIEKEVYAIIRCRFEAMVLKSIGLRRSLGGDHVIDITVPSTFQETVGRGLGPAIDKTIKQLCKLFEGVALTAKERAILVREYRDYLFDLGQEKAEEKAKAVAAHLFDEVLDLELPSD